MLNVKQAKTLTAFVPKIIAAKNWFYEEGSNAQPHNIWLGDYMIHEYQFVYWGHRSIFGDDQY